MKAVSPWPVADLYLSWNTNALYLGLYAQDIVELGYYRDKTLPEIDRAEWIVQTRKPDRTLRIRLGPFAPPICSEPSLRIVNLAGIYMNTRNVAALEIPAKYFDRPQFEPGDNIDLESTFFSHARADRVDWRGTFILRGSRN